jgi:aminoglycoside phosphotransferase (APT) family kinase protein
MAQEPYLRRIGVPEDQLEKNHQYIKDYHFSPRGRYIHGDFSARNSAVISQEPLKLAIFDPNALIGDPSWDIAVMANNRAYQKCRLESDDKQCDLYQRDTQLLIGLRQGYGRRIDEGSLAISQLAQAAFHASNKDKPDASSLEGRAWRRCVTDQINSLLRELKNEA